MDFLVSLPLTFVHAVQQCDQIGPAYSLTCCSLEHFSGSFTSCRGTWSSSPRALGPDS